MECPRCGEDCLPGLERCFSCGQTLAGSVERPASFIPRVRSANPLERRHRPSRLSRSALLERFSPFLTHPLVPCVLAGVLGLIPGPGALWRGRRLLGLGLSLLAVAGAFAIVETWRSDLQIPAWRFLFSLMATSSAIEAQARLAIREPHRTLVSILLAAVLALALRFALVLSFAAIFPQLRLTGELPILPRGTYLLEGSTITEIAHDDIVAFDVGDWTHVGRVMGLPGEGGIDDEPVPPDTILVTEGTGDLLLSIRDLRGRVFYQWLPRSARGYYPPPGSPP